jgi:hypothetical protein
MGVVLAACSGEPATTENDEVIDTAPLTIADGLQQLEKIDRLAAKHGVSKELLAEARLVRDSMDVLNGLVDQIQVAPDHTLSFFPSDDGSLVVAERRPNATASVFPSDETTMSLQEMYSRFAPGRTIPNTLLSTVSVTTAAAPKVDVPASVGGGAQYVAPTQGSTATRQFSASPTAPPRGSFPSASSTGPTAPSRARPPITAS